MHEGIANSNVYSYIKKYEESNEIIFKAPKGPPVKLETPKLKNRINFFFKNQP